MQVAVDLKGGWFERKYGSIADLTPLRRYIVQTISKRSISAN